MIKKIRDTQVKNSGLECLEFDEEGFEQLTQTILTRGIAMMSKDALAERTWIAGRGLDSLISIESEIAYASDSRLHRAWPDIENAWGDEDDEDDEEEEDDDFYDDDEEEFDEFEDDDDDDDDDADEEEE
jgi:hypothetical protein